MESNYLADKSWMYKYKNKYDRVNPHFLSGVECFMQFATRDMDDNECLEMKCPCMKCENKFYHDKETVHFHIVREGFTQGYTTWHFHGVSRKRSREEVNPVSGSVDDMVGMLNDIFIRQSDNDNAEGRERNEEVDKFNQFMEEARKPLYPGCTRYSKLSFIVRLFQLKCLHKWSNKSFSAMLALFKDALPDGNTLPNSWYESKKMMSELGLSCKKIHACPNDCVLFQNEYENLNQCPKCNASRWKERASKTRRTNNVPVKVLRHFPLIPRLQRLFMCDKTADLMTWHYTALRDEDGKMSHPRDSIAWKDFDLKHPTFSGDPRNIRLGLASDGFSPFKIAAGSSRSTWPVIIIVYNLPPWLAMKQSYFMMPLLIDGPRSPGNDIDIYLQPLIDELKILWEHGVETYDANRKELFYMHAAVLWTINDFPAYGMLSGWSTKGYMACPVCHVYHGSIHLPFSRKCVYMRHRRFLPPDHPWRNDIQTFNGKVEHELAPSPLYGEDVLRSWEGYNNVIFGKIPKDAHQSNRNQAEQLPVGWKKLSIFFELPYWKTLLVRMCLGPLSGNLYYVLLYTFIFRCSNQISTGIAPQTRSKRVANVMHNDTTLIPATVRQKGHAPSPPVVKKRCVPNQKSAPRVEISFDNEVENLDPLNNGADVISQNRSTLGPLPGILPQIGNLDPLDNGAYEDEFPPYVGVDEIFSEDIHESNSSNVQAFSTSISEVRKTRGPTQKTAFQPPQGIKWTCMFVRGQPVGEPSSKLAGTLGLYARNEAYFCPYQKWKQQSMQSFNDVMKEIMVHFDFVNEEGMPANMEDVNRFCYRSLQIKLKEWRCELKKKGYMKGKNEELSVEPPEQRITQATWDCLVQYWGTDEKIREFERNQKNRAQEQATHTLGAKSIARHNQEQREKLGDSYTTLGAYIKAHQTKGGDYPNEHTRSICEKVIEACQEKDLMSSSEPTILSPILDAVCNGHHGGFERGCGLGWSRMSRWGDSGNQASNYNIKQLTIELQNAKAEIEAMHARDKEREEAMKAREKEREEAMKAREAKREEAMQAREREMQARMERMEAMLTMRFSES